MSALNTVFVLLNGNLTGYEVLNAVKSGVGAGNVKSA